MTDKFENFVNGPIQEALLDFRVSFKSTPVQAQFDELVPLLVDRYPTNKIIFKYGAKFEFSDGHGSSNHESNFAGIRFESASDNFIFQAQVDGFTLSKLKPYRNWEELINEAKSVWASYSSKLNPITIVNRPGIAGGSNS